MFKRILLCTCLLFWFLTGYSQVVTECPRNIGFENGTLANWQCYTGAITTGASGRPEVMVSPSPAIAGRHTIIAKNTSYDPYGGFSLNAPNGSDYVVQLGNNTGGHQAESISYTIVVPSEVESYSVIFNYAVVFYNPLHQPDQQPKFTAKVVDVTTNTSTSCGSFEFVSSANLPGFELSPVMDSVYYKPWSPVMVNLTDYIGHTIRLEFTTNDCSFEKHWGYAYIDFNENCSIPITGNITCTTAKALTLNVLPGFSQYRWFNASTEQDLGTQSSVVLDPIPPVGTKIGVELIPYDGLGCTQVLYTYITKISMQVHDPPAACISVDMTATSVTVGNSSDLTYTYWKNSQATIPVTNPKKVTADGIYYIRALSSSGCFLVMPVNVMLIHPEAPEITDPAPVTYPTTVDITRTFLHSEGLRYTYWANADATIPLVAPSRVRLLGTYYIKATDNTGCNVIRPVHVRVIITDIVIPNTFTPNGDGVNDVFTILVNDQIKIDYFRIYNRWGSPVYETSNITQYWDGFTRNAMAPVGVYYWIMETEENSKKYKRSGSVTVIR